jgi:hypothetical protein
VGVEFILLRRPDLSVLLVNVMINVAIASVGLTPKNVDASRGRQGHPRGGKVVYPL